MAGGLSAAVIFLGFHLGAATRASVNEAMSVDAMGDVHSLTQGKRNNLTDPTFQIPEKDKALMQSDCWREATGAAHNDEFLKGYEYVIAEGTFKFDKGNKLAQGGGPREVSAKLLERMTKVVLAYKHCDVNAVAELIVNGNQDRGLDPDSVREFVAAVNAGQDINWQKHNLREYLSAAYGLEKPMAEAFGYWSYGLNKKEEMVKRMENDSRCIELDGVVDLDRVMTRRIEIDRHCSSRSTMAFGCCLDGEFFSLTHGWVRWLLLPNARQVCSVDGTRAWDCIHVASTARFTIKSDQVMNLTDGETAVHRECHLRWKAKYATAWKTPDDVMLFSSGGNVWSLSDVNWPGTQTGFIKFANSLGMRTTAGPSGTTNRYMLAAMYMLLDLEELFMLRLAIIAWFVSVADHSMLEVLLGASDANNSLSFPQDKTIMNPSTILPDLAGASKAFTAARKQFIAFLNTSLTRPPSENCK